MVIKGVNEKEIGRLITDILKESHMYNERGTKYNIKLSLGYAYISNSRRAMTYLFSKADKNMYEDKFKRKQYMSLENAHSSTE